MSVILSSFITPPTVKSLAIAFPAVAAILGIQLPIVRLLTTRFATVSINLIPQVVVGGVLAHILSAVAI